MIPATSRKRTHLGTTAAALIALATGCGQGQAPPSVPAPAEPPKAAAPAAPATPAPAAWELDNPLAPLPKPPLGVQVDFTQLSWVTPEKVRLGRWLFYDNRVSADGTLSCATCHRPENAFSEPTPVSTGVKGQKGGRKAPTFLNGAQPFYPVYFWDGRAASLQEQAAGPMANPIEMGNSHEQVVNSVAGVGGYKKHFLEAYGDEAITLDRITEAIAAYEATRLSGNSAFDRWEAGDKAALNEVQKAGRDLFFGKGECAQCHVGWNFTDWKFHNLGIGWDEKAGKATAKGGKPGSEGFADPGRAKVSKDEKETGAFKTPTLRDVTKHAPYMHDGSLATLKDVVMHYDKGGNQNPWLSERVRPLKLTPQEVDALVAFMGALDGEGYQDNAPKSFPQ